MPRGARRPPRGAPPSEPRWPNDVPSIALTALQHVRATGTDPADAARIVLASRALHSRQRGPAADLLFDLSRLGARLDARIRHAHPARKLSPDERDRFRIAALLHAEQGKPAPEVARPLGLEADAVSALSDPHFLDGLTGPERLSVAHAFPRWLVEDLLADGIVGDVGALLEALNARAPLYVRARQDRDALLRELTTENVPARATPWSPLGIELLRHVNVRALPAFRDGRLEVQDLGSQLIALAVGARPGELVVDACAGAGGKTLALLALEPGISAVAMEPFANRLDELRDRTRRAHVRVDAIKGAVGDESTRRYFGRADAVLVDAPCSGVGALRREPQSRWRYSRDDVTRFSQEQARIARLSLHLLRPGGRLIYATCSLFKRENEDVVNALLDERKDLRPIPLVELMGPVAGELGATGHMLRVMPHTHNTDGFFMAALRLSGEAR